LNSKGENNMDSSQVDRMAELTQRFAKLEPAIDDSPQKEALSILHAMIQQVRREMLRGSLNSNESSSRAFEKDGLLFFTPDVTKATTKWRPRPGVHDNNYQDILQSYRSEYDFVVKEGNYDPALAGKPFLLADERDHDAEPLSFDLVRRAVLKEYGRRFAEYREGGGEPYSVQPPPLLTAGERRSDFARQFAEPLLLVPQRVDPAVHGIAVGKPVTASAALAPYPPRFAADGATGQLRASWQTDPYPAWLKIDLEKPAKIGRIHVYTYWGGGRYYRYNLEVSANDKEWRRVVDRSKNTTPASPNGDDHRFEPITARFVRVNMLYHSLNRGVHIVEVRVFGAE